jgi:hypothetical protein
MKPSILVVEDDLALCELLTWNPGAEGYDLRSTGEGGTGPIRTVRSAGRSMDGSQK